MSMTERQGDDLVELIRSMDRRLGGFASQRNSTDSDDGARKVLSAGLNRTAHKTRESLEGLSNAASGSGTGLKELLIGFGISSSAIGVLVSAIDSQVSSYNSMVKMGDTFGGSMLNMNMAAGQAGMGLGEFVKVMEKAGEGVRLLGGKQFAEMSRNVQNANPKLREMGLSTLEINEGLGEYIETVRLGGNIQRVSTDEMERQYVKLATGIGDLSKQTGKSRKDIEAAFKDLAKNDVVVGALAGMTQGMADDVKMRMTAITQLLGKEGAAMAESFVSTGSMFVKDGGKVSGLISSLAPGLTSTMEDFMSGRIDQATFTAKLAASGQSISSVQQQLSQLQTAGVDGASGAMEMMNKFAQINAKAEADSKPMTRALQLLSQVFSSIHSSLMNGFFKPFEHVFNDSQLDKHFEKLAEVVGPLAEGLGKLVGYFVTAGIQLATFDFSGFFTIKDGFEAVSKSVWGVIAVLALFKAAIIATTAVRGMSNAATGGGIGARASAVASGIKNGSVMQSVKGAVFGNNTAPHSQIPANHPSQQISNNMGNAGQNAAQQVGSLKSSFANAAGTALQMIAFAASVWIISKAFQNFAELSWEGIAKGVVGTAAVATVMVIASKALQSSSSSLAAAAPGIGLFGLALLPFAAGIALVGVGLGQAAPAFDAFGTIIGKTFSGISETMKTLFDGIIQLSAVGMAGLVGTAGGLGALGVALAAFGGGAILAGIGSLFGGGIISGIERLAGVSDRIGMVSASIATLTQSFRELQNTDIGKIDAVAGSMGKLADVMERAQRGPSISSIIASVVQRATATAPNPNTNEEDPNIIISKNTADMVKEIKETNRILREMNDTTKDTYGILRTLTGVTIDTSRRGASTNSPRPS